MYLFVFRLFFHYRLLQDIEYIDTEYYTQYIYIAGLYWSSVLYMSAKLLQS